MDAVLLPDILLIVFQYTDFQTDVFCAQVCRTWNQNVLDFLWHRVTRPERLLRLLGPVGHVNPNLVVRYTSSA